jgi:hypothetical protein
LCPFHGGISLTKTVGKLSNKNRKQWGSFLTKQKTVGKLSSKTHDVKARKRMKKT